MQTLFNQLSQPLGITLLHSLWQGLIIYALLRIVLLCIPSATPANKYNLALLALAACVIWPVGTLLIELSKQQSVTSAINDGPGSFDLFIPLHNSTSDISDSFSLTIGNYLPYLVVLWLIGIVLQSGRLLWGWRNIYQIKQTTTSNSVFQDQGDQIVRLLHISREVKILLSDAINVPCAIGYLKPIVIIPTAIITQFSAEQIRSILVHELSHIRRNDYIINLLQQVISILFFFNPFVYLINKMIHTEREHACDDMVLKQTGQPLIYAQTLLHLEQYRNNNYQLALAATGKKYQLLNRIKRIMETKKQTSNIRHILAAILLLAGSMGTIAWLNPEIKGDRVLIRPANLSHIRSLFNDTTHVAKKTSKTVAVTKSKNKDRSKVYDSRLNELSAEMDKHSQAISNYYESDELKKLQEQLDKKSSVVAAYFERHDVKDLQAKQDKYSQEFQSKWGNADEQDVIYMKTLALHMKFNKYMNSAEYKELDKRLQAKYDIKPLVEPQYPFMKMLDRKNKNYPAYQKELTESAPEDVKRIRAEINELQKQRKVYNKSPDEQARELRTLADSMRRTFNDPQIQQTQQDIQKLTEAIRDYQNNPEIKKEQALLKTLAAKIKAYSNKPRI